MTAKPPSFPEFDLFGEVVAPGRDEPIVFGELETERVKILRSRVRKQVLHHEEHRQACEVREIRRLHHEKGDGWLRSHLNLVESTRGKEKAEELRQLLS